MKIINNSKLLAYKYFATGEDNFSNLLGMLKLHPRELKEQISLVNIEKVPNLFIKFLETINKLKHQKYLEEILDIIEYFNNKKRVQIHMADQGAIIEVENKLYDFSLEGRLMRLQAKVLAKIGVNEFK